MISKPFGAVGDDRLRIMPAMLGTWRIQLPLSGNAGEPINAGLERDRVQSLVMIFSGKTEAYA